MLPQRLVPWRLVGRAAWWVLIGVVGSLALMGGTLMFAAQDYCDYECSTVGWLNPVNPLARLYIRHLMDEVILPPQDAPPNPLTKADVQNAFEADPHYFAVHMFMMDYLKYIKNGTYVEVGAGDGEFLSLTSQLEVMYGWRGLLIEPRTDAFKNIRARRKAAAANVCVSGGDYHVKNHLWTPKPDEDFTPLLQKISDAKSVLLQYVNAEDRIDGTTELKQCYTLESLIIAYEKMINKTSTPIDLLLLNTGAGELGMLEQLDIPKYLIHVALPIKNSIEESFTLEIGLKTLLNSTFTMGGFNYGFYQFH